MYREHVRNLENNDILSKVKVLRHEVHNFRSSVLRSGGAKLSLSYNVVSNGHSVPPPPGVDKLIWNIAEC